MFGGCIRFQKKPGEQLKEQDDRDDHTARTGGGRGGGLVASSRAIEALQWLTALRPHSC